DVGMLDLGRQAHILIEKRQLVVFGELVLGDELENENTRFARLANLVGRSQIAHADLVQNQIIADAQLLDLVLDEQVELIERHPTQLDQTAGQRFRIGVGGRLLQLLELCRIEDLVFLQQVNQCTGLIVSHRILPTKSERWSSEKGDGNQRSG